VRHSIGNDVQREEKINCFYFSSKLEIVRFTLELELSLCTQIGNTEQKTLVLLYVIPTKCRLTSIDDLNNNKKNQSI